jgi:hypothetical protein
MLCNGMTSTTCKSQDVMNWLPIIFKRKFSSFQQVIDRVSTPTKCLVSSCFDQLAFACRNRSSSVIFSGLLSGWRQTRCLRMVLDPLCQLIVSRHCFFSLPGSFGALQNRTPAKVLCSIQPPHIIPPHHYNPQYPTSHDDVPKYDVLWVERLRISSSIFGQPLFRWKPQCSG